MERSSAQKRFDEFDRLRDNYRLATSDKNDSLAKKKEFKIKVENVHNQLFGSREIYCYMYCIHTDGCSRLSRLLTTDYYDHPIMDATLNYKYIDLIEKYEKLFNEYADVRKECTRASKICQNHGCRLWKFINNNMDMYEGRSEKFMVGLHKELNKMPKSMITLDALQPSSGEQAVIDHLEVLKDKYQLYYFYKHKWEHCKDIHTLENDFFCILVHDMRFIPFVIEYDGDQHYNKITHFNNYKACHRHDILKQYYLSRMSIHLLRINTNDSVRSSINNFIKEIINTDTYVIVGGINPNPKIFASNTTHRGMFRFHNNHFEKRKDTWKFLARVLPYEYVKEYIYYYSHSLYNWTKRYKDNICIPNSSCDVYEIHEVLKEEISEEERLEQIKEQQKRKEQEMIAREKTNEAVSTSICIKDTFWWEKIEC